MTDLKSMANPNYGLTNELRISNESLSTLIVLIGALCDSNDLIVELKEQQKKNDSKWRMLWDDQKKYSTYISLGALFLSVATFYLYIARLGGLANAIKDIF